MSDNINDMISELSQRLGVSPENLKSAANRGNAERLLDACDSDTANQARQILNDPEKTKQILDSPSAQALLKYFKD